MASLIKNQILKHLSRFTKNLSGEQLNVSAIKGEGELRGLELDEVVLMDLLEVPVWLRLTKATANRLLIKIPWTKLKSTPISICLDEVLVEMETCEELRTTSNISRLPDSSGGKYGFPDKVVDGMTVTINTVEVKFRSRAFHATIQLSRLRLESRSPTWQRTDLRFTRLKEANLNQMLMFKELEWETLRVEAWATPACFPGQTQILATPLRLLTNQARCRITIKKSLADCSVVASRLVVLFNDLLWVLTDEQIQAALIFLTSLVGLIQKAHNFDQKVKAAKKLETMSSGQRQQQNALWNPAMSQAGNPTALFHRYDMIETSCHIVLHRIDLHFCDEARLGEGRSSYPDLKEGGALQVTLTKLIVDYYPYHVAFGERKHWLRYSDTMTSRSDWAEKLSAAYKQQLAEALQPGTKSNTASKGSISGLVNNHCRCLMAMAIVLRLSDFAIYKVSTSAAKNRPPEKFVSSDKEQLPLPGEQFALHLEVMEFYHPTEEDFPVPLPNVYLHANPILVIVDPTTIIWLQAFALNLKRLALMHRTKEKDADEGTPEIHKPMDVRIEAVMPKVVIPATNDITGQPDRPTSLQLQVSRLVVTNCRLGDGCTRVQLSDCLSSYQASSLVYNSRFPAKRGDVFPVIQAFLSHAQNTDSKPVVVRPTVAKRRDSGFHRSFLWTENKSIWCVQLEPAWADFCGMESRRNRPVAFMDAVPVTLWVHLVTKNSNESLDSFNGTNICDVPLVNCDSGSPKLSVIQPKDNGNEPLNETTSTNKYLELAEDWILSPGPSDDCNIPLGIYLLVHVRNVIGIQLNHYQFIFLMRVSETMTDLALQLAKDAKEIATYRKLEEPALMSVAAIIEEVTFSAVSPTVCEVTKSEGHRRDSPIGDVLSQFINGQKPSGVRESYSDQQIRDGVVASSADGKLLASSCSDFTLHSMKSQEDGVVEDADEWDGAAPSADDVSHSDVVQTVENMEEKMVLLDVTGHSTTQPLKQVGRSQKLAGFITSQANKAVSSIPVLSISPLDNGGSATFSSGFGSLSSSLSSSVPSLTFEKMTSPLERTVTSGTSIMKKGVSSLISGLDSAASGMFSSGSLGSTTPTSPSVRVGRQDDTQSLMDESIETMSIRSDLSTDSDQFVMLNSDPLNSADETVLSQPAPPEAIEVANEVKEDTGSEVSSVASSFKRLDLMNIVTFHIGGIEFTMQSRGLDSSVKVQFSSIHTDEMTTSTWEDFQSQFSMSSRQDSKNSSDVWRCEVRLRLEKGPCLSNLGAEAVERGFAAVTVNDLRLSLTASAATLLADMLEDEMVPKPLPLVILAHRIALHLQEDRPSPNLTSPGKIPLNVHVNSAVIVRTPDGTFHFKSTEGQRTRAALLKVSSQATVTDTSALLEPACRSSSIAAQFFIAKRPSLDDVEERLYQLEEHNEQLRLKVIDCESLRAENQRLKESLAAVQPPRESDSPRKENSVLNHDVSEAEVLLREAQDEIKQLLEERKTLMETLKLLQEELIASEHNALSRSSSRTLE